MIRTVVIGLALGLSLGNAFADEDKTDMASTEEAAKVTAAIAKVGCKAEEIEKESANLFEIDDAQCEIGQYDMKLNGEYKITVMTIDE